MAKQSKQEQFHGFVDAQEVVAPFRHTLRGLGIDGNSQEKPPNSAVLELLVNQLCEKVQRAVAGQQADGPQVDFRTLLGADISAFLQPFVMDDRKGAISMLDVVTLGLTDTPDIKRFLKRHGSDLEEPKDLKYVHTVLQEAIAFFDEIIAAKPQDKIHPSLKITKNIDGIAKIFQTAAGKHQRQLVPQACGLLRVAAAIDFLNRDPLLSVLPDAEEALQELHDKHFSTPSKGKTFFKTGTPGEVPMEIVRCELRTKERKRMIAKLLHKPQNNTKEVVDHIGMRITTKSAFEALQFLYLAFFKPGTAIFPSMTIRIGETKQLLFNEAKLIEALRNQRKARDLVNELATQTNDQSELTTVGEDTALEVNKHSSRKYRAIQVTFDWPLDAKNGQRVHFPVEIQIVDQASRAVNENAASHVDYVQRQTQSVRNRLMGNNLLARFSETENTPES